MVYGITILNALAVLGPLANAAAVTVTATKTQTKTYTATTYATVTKTLTSTSTTLSTTTKTNTITQKTTATAPVSITTQTLPAQTITVTQTPPAQTVTTTQTLPAETSTSTQTLPAQTVTTTQTITATQTLPAQTVTAISTVTGSCSTSNPTTITTSTSSTSTTSATTATTNPTTTRTALQATGTMGLNDYAKAAGRYLGTAVDIPGTGEASDPVYMAVANNTHEFGSRTPANVMKYVYTEPEQGQFDFSGGDYFIQMAQQAGISHIRCHNLVWHQQLPYWLTSGTWDNATLIEIMTNHITQLIAHFGDNCYCWDVVNEALADDGTWRQDIWYNTIGPNYVAIAFQAAQAAVAANNLKVKLYYNDYSIEGPGAKTNSALQLVQNLTSAGIQIDGVGLQAHFIIGETWYYTTQETNLQSFTALGVEVAYTELDVRASSLPVSATDQINQFNAYKWTVTACANVPGCVGVTLWDFDDTYSWVPSTFSGQGYACPWFLNQTSGQLIKKIAYDGIIDGFDGGNNY